MSKKIITTKIAIFQKKEIRKTLKDGEWWFSVADVVEALTDSVDVKQYIKKMRKRDQELNSNWGTICTPLEMIAKDGKKELSAEKKGEEKVKIPASRQQSTIANLIKVEYNINNNNRFILVV